jgi:molybdopterin-guanine dinucleotide biosynthesis adapter protein
MTSASVFHSPVVGIAGWKKSGKTTLTVRLVEEFARRGLRVATVKHAHHAFNIDEGETDSARHRRAGAGQVAIVSAKRWAMITEITERDEPDLVAVIGALAPCDLILVEGYKAAAIPKIEARRTASASSVPLANTDPHVFAIAADHPVVDACGRAIFALDDIQGLAALIASRFLRAPGAIKR